jgi:ribosomal protein S18 acetylase RimI-like enzyme
VAPALLDATLAVGFARAEQIELGVRIGNPAAERLYASRGFVRYGIEPRSHRVDGVDHDDALMVAYRP